MKNQLARNAKERIMQLFKEAEKAFDEDKARANRYVELARKIAMKGRIRIPRELKRRFCKHCYAYLKQGKNVRVRNRDGLTVYTCMECNGFMRFPHRK